MATIEKCKNKQTNTFIPLKHQIDVTKYFTTSNKKGLLLFHKLGSGKSCTSIMIADAMLKNNMANKIIICSPASLRQSWVNEYCNVCGQNSYNFETKFLFISYNSPYYKKINSINFTNSLIIIDEVHNFINGVKNKSTNNFKFYERLKRTNCRILALSATPFKNKQELSLLFELINPGQRNIFIDLFKDTNFFKNVISYYKDSNENIYLPKVTYVKPFRIKMTNSQFSKYKALENMEEQTLLKAKSFKFKTYNEYLRHSRYKPNVMSLDDFNKFKQRIIMAKQHILTRQISNCNNDIIPKKQISEEEKDQNISTEFPDLLQKNGGWISDSILKKQFLVELSPKIVFLLLNILKHLDKKQIVYTFFKNKSGANLINSLLQKCGIKSEIFSGDINQKDKLKLLQTYNSPSNRNGEYIQVLIVTKAGMEGINLLETNYLHILESQLSNHETKQIIGRVVRFKSHFNMPKNRQFVKIYKYWSVSPISSNDKLIDEKLYNMNSERFTIENTIDSLLIENSIEKNLQ